MITITNNLHHKRGVAMKNLTKQSLISDIEFKVWYKYESDIVVGVTINGIGNITVMERETGYGYGTIDVETGFKDVNDKFWLVSGRFDIRNYPSMPIEEAISFIKGRANTCVGV